MAKKTVKQNKNKVLNLDKVYRLNISDWEYDTGSNSTFKNAKVKLELAAKDSTRTIRDHFKKDGWALDYSYLVADLFHSAFGVQLESFLLAELTKNYSFKLEQGVKGLLLTELKPRKVSGSSKKKLKSNKIEVRT